MAGLLRLPQNVLSQILPSVGSIDEILELRRVCKRFSSALKLSALTVRHMQVTFEDSKPPCQNRELDYRMMRMPAWRTLSKLNVQILDLKYQAFAATMIEFFLTWWQLQQLDISYSSTINQFVHCLSLASQRPEIADGCKHLEELRISGIKKSEFEGINFELFPKLKRLYADNVISFPGEVTPFPKTLKYLSLRPLELLHAYNSALYFPSPSSTCVLCLTSSPLPELTSSGVNVEQVSITELITRFFVSGGGLIEMERWVALGGHWNVHNDGKLEIIAALESIELKEELLLKLAKFLYCNGLSRKGCRAQGCRHSLLTVSFKHDFPSVFSYLLSINAPLYTDSEDIMQEIITKGSITYFNLILETHERMPQRELHECNELCFAFEARQEDIAVRLLRMGVTPASCKHRNVLTRAPDLMMKLLRAGELDHLEDKVTFQVIQRLLMMQKDEMAVEWIQKFHLQLQIVKDEGRYLSPENSISFISDMNKPLSILAIVRSTQENHCSKSFTCLLNLGFDPNTKDPYRWTPLIAASSIGSVETVKTLLSLGASVNDADRSGRTALHQSAQYGHLSIVEMLLAAGADVTARSARNELPIDLARVNKWSEVEKVITAKGSFASRIKKKCIVF